MSDYQSAVYFKEYPCYHFPLHQHTQIKPIISFQCNFEYSNRKIQTNPPAAIIDKLSKNDTMYLLQWKKDEAGVNLYWRRFEKEKEWILIKMNYYPDYIHICGGTLFLIANKQMYIVISSSNQSLLKPLVRDMIISVTPCLVAVASKNVVKYQPGIYALCFNQQQGYYAVEYSPNATNTRKKGFLNSMSKMFNRLKTFNFSQKYKEFIYIEVLIPNILALAFLTPTEFCLFNLQTMELMPNLKGTLIEASLINQKPIIRFKSHSSLGTYQQTFMIMIGVGSIICSFYLMFKYNQMAIHFDHFYRQPLTNFNEGSFINWAQVQIRPYLVYIADGSILEDMQIMVRGLVYYARKNTADLIGKYRYLQMTAQNGQCEHPIMNQECTIWKYYYQDQKEENVLKKDRLLIPNRYPYELLKHLSQKYEDTSKLKEKIFNTWRNEYKFSSFLIYEDELLIVRKSSISVFRQINQSLYHWLNFTEQQLQKIQTQAFFKNIFEGQNQKQIMQDEFQENNLCFNSIMPLIKERMYFEPEEDIEKKRIAEVHKKFKNAYDSLQEILLIRHQYTTANVTIQQLTRDLISGKLRDKLCYYNLALGSKVYFCNKDRERNSNKVFQKQNFVIKLIDYFYGLYHRSANYYQYFGHNLIDLFINKCSKQLSEDIDTAVSILLKKMLLDLIPKEVSNNYESSMINPEINGEKMFSNPFVQFVISLTKECYEQNKSQELLLLRQQLERFLKLGFLDNKSIFFSQFYRNKSLIKALFVSDSEQLIKSIFLRLLFSRDSIQTLLKLYKPQKKYISQKNCSFIEIQMFFSQKYSNLEFDLQHLITNSYYLDNDDFDGQQNKYKVQKLQGVIRTIFNSQLNSINLVRTDNFQPIQEMFDQLTQNTQNIDSQLEMIQKIELQTTTQTGIYDPQQQLQFSQKVLTTFVDLFNQKVKQDSQLGYYIQNQPSPKQTQEFINSRQILSKILGCIKTSLQNYINRFQNYYGKTDLEGYPNISYQQRLMSQTFLEKPLRLIQGETGPILSEVLIRLVFRALNCKDMDRDKEYHNPLNKFANLIHFWKHSITQGESQSKLYKTYINTNLWYRKITSKQQQSKLYEHYFAEEQWRKPIS